MHQNGVVGARATDCSYCHSLHCVFLSVPRGAEACFAWLAVTCSGRDAKAISKAILVRFAVKGCPNLRAVGAAAPCRQCVAALLHRAAVPCRKGRHDVVPMRSVQVRGTGAGMDTPTPLIVVDGSIPHPGGGHVGAG